MSASDRVDRILMNFCCTKTKMSHTKAPNCLDVSSAFVIICMSTVIHYFGKGKTKHRNNYIL